MITAFISALPVPPFRRGRCHHNRAVDSTPAARGISCFTQQQIADALGVPRRTVSYWLIANGISDIVAKGGSDGNLATYGNGSNNTAPITLYPCKYEEANIPKEGYSNLPNQNDRQAIPTLVEVGIDYHDSPKFRVLVQEAKRKMGQLLKETERNPGTSWRNIKRLLLKNYGLPGRSCRKKATLILV